MSDSILISKTTDPAIGAAAHYGEQRVLRVLVLSRAPETTLHVDPDGQVSLYFATGWAALSRELQQHSYDLVAIEAGDAPADFDGEKLALLRKSYPDLHVVLFGTDVSDTLARNALRSGVTGIIRTGDRDALWDTPLQLVAEGKVFVDSALASQLIGESEEYEEHDQPVISLNNTVALVADDDEYFRMAVVTILQDEFGFSEVLEASNLEQAKQHMERRNRIDLALFDLGMPGMFGASSLQGLRLEHPQVRKLAVVSASRNRNDVLESLASGTYGYVAKSEGVSELKHALTQIMKGRVYAPALLHELPEPNKSFLFSVEAGQGHEKERDPEKVAEASRYVPQDVECEVDLDAIPELSPRQRKVLELLVQGMSNKEIARELDLGVGTVKVHITALFSKLGVSNRTSAVAVGAKLL
ncbi:MAG: response regulator transcription factor [Thalassovita sp.]|nr:response regulator transcription factor [Thalassovita sp.]